MSNTCVFFFSFSGKFTVNPLISRISTIVFGVTVCPYGRKQRIIVNSRTRVLEFDDVLLEIPSKNCIIHYCNNNKSKNGIVLQMSL